MSKHSAKTKASDLFIRCLEAEGIQYVFGVPGEENADFLLSLEASPIEFIMTRHEQGAAFMAEIYGRLTGDPAVCIATLGPGATNLLTPVADANMDRAPLLAITGQGSTRRLHKESHQIINVESIFSPVTKWTATVRLPESIPELVRKAVRLARAEKPGAVLLELPEDIAGTEATGVPIPPNRFRRPVPEAGLIDAAYECLRSAKTPVVLAGNGAIRTRASRELRRFCAQTGIGTISTFMAKGAVDMDSDCCLFTIGLSQKDIVSKAIDDADLIITIGYDMVEYPPELWNGGNGTDIIHIDFLPAEIDESYQPRLELVGDIAGALGALNDRLEADGVPVFELEVQRDVRAAMLEEFARHKSDSGHAPVRPQKVLWDVRATLGRTDILLSGVGAHKMWIARYYHAHEPNTCLIPNGFCSMGAALPGAIGAKLAKPDAQVLAIAGDGDFLMNVQEMETAARLGLNITVMVWEDHAYGLIAWKQKIEFGRHTDLTFTNPDWQQLASAFGWTGHMVSRAEDLAGTLKQALREDGPSLIVVPIDYDELAELTKQFGKVEMRM